MGGLKRVGDSQPDRGRDSDEKKKDCRGRVGRPSILVVM